MANDIVKTTFQTGPSDSAATVDAYKSTSTDSSSSSSTSTSSASYSLSSVITPITTLTSKLSSTSKDSLANSIGGVMKDLPSMVASYKSASGAMTSSQVLNLLSSSSSSFGNIYKGMNSTLQSSIANNIPTSALPKNISASINGSVSTLSVGNLTNAKSLTSMMSALTSSIAGTSTSSFSLSNQSSVAAVMSSVFKTASGMGFTGIASTLLSSLGTSSVISYVSKLIAKAAASAGKTSDFSSAASTSKGAHTSNLVYNFAYNYSETITGKKLSALLTEYDTIITAFGNIDANWDKLVRDTTDVSPVTGNADGSVYDLHSINVSNDTFKTLIKRIAFSGDRPLSKVLYMAQYITTSDVATELTKRYSAISFSFNTTTSSTS